MQITTEEFNKRSAELHDTIRKGLDSTYGEFNGWPASQMVDVRLEVHPDTHVVGIRMDNNYGIVGADDATRFSRALMLATCIAAASDLVGCEVVDG